MSVLNALRHYIISDSAVSALIGSRFYPTALPQKPKLPAVTYQLISGTRRATMRHDDNLPAKRIQIDAWSPSADEAYDVAEAIREVFHYYVRGEIGDSPDLVMVVGVLLLDERADYEADTMLHRISRDYLVFHEE